jgi:acetyl esterase/lipase
MKIAAVIWAVIAGLALLGLVLPKVPGPVLAGLAVSVYGFNLYLLLPALAGAGLSLWAWRAGQTGWLVLVSAMTALLIAAVAVPTWRLSQSARHHGVELSLPAYFSGPDGGTPRSSTTETYAVADGAELKVDIWRPAKPNGASMVYVFGGGWVSGERNQMPAYFQWLTAQGLTVFTIDYRLATDGEPVWDKAPDDVRRAVRWVGDHAARLGIDPDRIVLSGNSAGGNLASLVAYSGDTPVRAVIQFYAPTDLAAAHRDTDSSTARGMLESYLGGTPATVPARYERNSPVNHVRPGLPPTLILHGERDSVVPVAQATDLAARLTTAGVPNELVLLPASEHSFDALFGGFANQIARPVISGFLATHVTN